ncbi:hypothetical protein Purlil1_3218 [Purpureocillium lilacinum]|uniref:Uncharacterized protein n=1 Tax=Purpureocillium lilacinum TaxID=33203 RepID=A0ABR0C8K1_PURLI|nr:hypothetical protein Purlil1_3218 [Purpureocillium lilacinum]
MHRHHLAAPGGAPSGHRLTGNERPGAIVGVVDRTAPDRASHSLLRHGRSTAPRLAPSESGALEQVDPRQISRGRPPFAPPPTTAPTYATSYKYTRRTGHRGGSGASFPCIFALWKHHLRTFFSFWMALAGLLWSWLAQCEAHVFVLGQGRTSQVAEMVTALGSPPTPARSLTIRLPRTPRQDLRLGKDKAPFGGGGFAPPPRVPRLVTYLRFAAA